MSPSRFLLAFVAALAAVPALRAQDEPEEILSGRCKEHL
jgi:hypothetical protein